ncbi:hypothetical protein AVEN_207158-1 [Araneus ventricosus]|uniref:Uncharacterized protein n=1 Tax=Araneus ventricosus TaxID=182803 RepID=A0A4Y2HLW5_ARAVE|nr:hypothetical protein AVEN_207158-1 [Araneus ventricosus]
MHVFRLISILHADVQKAPHVPVPEAIIAAEPVGWTWHMLMYRAPPCAPVPDAITATEPVEWTQDKDANSTRCSQVVALPSTDRSRYCLTAVIRREPVLSAWYGRWHADVKGVLTLSLQI